MKVFISVDMEGISGIVDSSQTNRDHKEFEKARALMAADVNAAIDGIIDLGEAEIVVSDGHGKMINIEPEALNKDAVLVRGTPKALSQGLKGRPIVSSFLSGKVMLQTVSCRENKE